ncbi:MAG TPA: histidine kinase transcriptional regulator protein, partial [Flavobacteriaceae bacterium]|nr:histidine kinase transcriptional regulator protein [Flavobacteriaceae bacterium]
FTIQPLWWQTLWFKIILGLLVTTLLLSTVWITSKQIQKKKDQKLIQEKQLSEIQLRALRSQMNPHFVFNSLSAIQYYINENNYEASEQYLVKFSKLIRQFFDLSKENEITLKEEIQLLKSYLEIEKLRFKDRLDFEIFCDENINTNHVKIPTMLLQPIVENAVNHGVFNKVENGKVTLKFNQMDTQTIKVKIIDDGVGFKNTKTEKNKHKSSNVIADRIKFLNQTEKWKITFKNEVLNPDLEDKGNQAIFTITNLS